MKLKEFVEIVKVTHPDDNLLMDNQLYGKNLEKYKEIILKTDEFKECESLDILEHPLSKSKDGKILTPYTLKLSDVMKVKGRCYLLSLTLTPLILYSSKLSKTLSKSWCISFLLNSSVGSNGLSILK